VRDGLADGRTVRVLGVVDTFTRECLALEVDTSFASPRVTRVLDAIIAERGRPRRLRMDNGSELTSRHFLSWGDVPPLPSNIVAETDSVRFCRFAFI